MVLFFETVLCVSPLLSLSTEGLSLPPSLPLPPPSSFLKYIFLFLQLHNFMPNVNLFFTTLVCLLICQLYCDLFTPLSTSLNKITEFMLLRASPTSAATLGEPSTSPGAQAARPDPVSLYKCISCHPLVGNRTL